VLIGCRFNLALAFFVPPAFTNIQWRTYMIFGTFCAVMFFHVFFFYPETAGKSLEEIDVVFEGTVPAWRSASIGGTFQDRVEAAERGHRSGEGLTAGGSEKTPERNGAAHHEEA